MESYEFTVWSLTKLQIRLGLFCSYPSPLPPYLLQAPKCQEACTNTKRPTKRPLKCSCSKTQVLLIRKDGTIRL